MPTSGVEKNFQLYYSRTFSHKKHRLKLFLRAVGHSTIAEKTKAVREKENSASPLWKLYALSRLRIKTKAEHTPCKSDFFEIERYAVKAAADVYI